MSSPQKILHALDIIQQQARGSYVKVEIAPDGVYSVYLSASSKENLHAAISDVSPLLKAQKSLTGKQQAALKTRGWRSVRNRVWSRD